MPELDTAVETVEPSAVDAVVAGDETPIEPDAPVETATEDVQPDGQAVAGQETVVEADGDGRVIPQAWRELFKGDVKLRDTFFRDKSFHAEFPGGITEAREYKEVFDTLGGKEGIEQLAQERQGWEQMDQHLAAGDPKAIEAMVTQSQEGFTKLMPAALETFAKLAPDDYAHVMSRVLVNTLTQGGFENALQLLATHAQSPEKINAIVDDMREWFKGFQQKAQNVPQRKVDPEREKLASDRKQFERERYEIFRESLTTEVANFQNPKVEQQLDKYLVAHKTSVAKLKKDDPDGYALLMENIDRALGKAMSADTAWVKGYHQILASRDRGKAVKAVTVKLERLIAGDDKTPSVVKKVYNGFYRIGSGPQSSAQRSAAAQQQRDPGAGGTGIEKTAKAPKPNEIDWGRVPKGYTTVEDAVLDNKAFVKGKKELVSWA